MPKLKEEPMEYLTVYTDVGDLSGRNIKRWVDFAVPMSWLMQHLELKRAMDISVALSCYSVDKERVLIAAIEDGVVRYGW